MNSGDPIFEKKIDSYYNSYCTDALDFRNKLDQYIAEARSVGCNDFDIETEEIWYNYENKPHIGIYLKGYRR